MNELITSMYFVNYGQRTGQFLIFIDFDETKEVYSILGVPESEPLYISKKDIEAGIGKKVLDFVEKLPTDVFLKCKDEFHYRINNK